jgi:hypothetical protein
MNSVNDCALQRSDVAGMMGTIGRGVEIAGKIARKPSHQRARSAVLFAAINICEAIISADEVFSSEQPSWECGMLEISSVRNDFLCRQAQRSDLPKKRPTQQILAAVEQYHARLFRRGLVVSARLMRNRVRQSLTLLWLSLHPPRSNTSVRSSMLSRGKAFGRRRGVDEGGVRTKPHPPVGHPS